MSDTPASPARSFSLGRVLALAVPLALVVWGANKIYSNNVELEKQQTDARGQLTTFHHLFGGPIEGATLDKAHKDADGDLLADAPTDAGDLKNPDELNFSVVAGGDSEGQEDTWKELIAALEASTGKKVKLQTYADTGEQIRAIKSGDLHVTAFSTGEAPAAVNEAGFIPVASFANEDGDYQITMKIIVPATSTIEKLEDLAPVEIDGKLTKRRITFVRPRSNTGCTAALVLLMNEYKLQPERDYRWGFSFDHEESIKGVAKNKFEAAAVASDILDRMLAAGEVDKDAIRVIYESEPFPPSVLGYAHNLTPELRDAITKALVDFAWDGTGLEKKYGASGTVKFAKVNYKDDWNAVREIREAGNVLLEQLAGQ